MENAKSILDKVSIFFAELVNSPMSDASGDVSGMPKAEVKMVAAKLQDGTEVEVTELAVGGIVTIKGQPAPVGEHMLEDGTKIVVGDNGVIMQLDLPEAPMEAPVIIDMSAKFAAFESATNEKFAAYENKFAEYEVKLTQANKVIQGLMDISKLLVEAPTSKADEGVKTANNFSKEVNARKAFEEFSKSICS
jgi:hypothetical protein